tara:strand:- start:703 stop:1461 length:759 start_codon:yes stop_codon:yes gene_type:complete
MLETEALLFIAFAMFSAGLVKGLVGLGLPVISLGLMMLAIDLKQAIIIVLVPLLITNLWQGLVGGHMLFIIKRIWLMLSTGAIAIWLTVGFMLTVNTAILSIALGTILYCYGAYGLMNPQIRLPERTEIVFSPLAGTISGVIAGLTGSLSIPAVFYLHALEMSRHVLIQAMGIWFCLGSIILSAALDYHNALPMELSIISAGATGPALVGMELGRRMRHGLSEKLFQNLFFCILIMLGSYISLRNLVKFSTL